MEVVAHVFSVEIRVLGLLRCWHISWQIADSASSPEAQHHFEDSHHHVLVCVADV